LLLGRRHQVFTAEKQRWQFIRFSSLDEEM
jgi:hypothetical protein